MGKDNVRTSVGAAVGVKMKDEKEVYLGGRRKIAQDNEQVAVCS